MTDIYIVVNVASSGLGASVITVIGVFSDLSEARTAVYKFANHHFLVPVNTGLGTVESFHYHNPNNGWCNSLFITKKLFTCRD